MREWYSASTMLNRGLSYHTREEEEEEERKKNGTGCFVDGVRWGEVGCRARRKEEKEGGKEALRFEFCRG